MLLLLFLAFILMPIVEIYVLISIGRVIGGFNTLFFVLLSGFLGAYFAHTQGRAILVRMQDNLRRGQVPADDVTHGMLVFIGGLLLIFPGFVTDVVGLLMVFPLTRVVILRVMRAYFSRLVQKGRVRVYTAHPPAAPYERDVTPEVIDVTPVESKTERRPEDQE